MSFGKYFLVNFFCEKILLIIPFWWLATHRSFAKPYNKQNHLILLIAEFPKAAVTDQDIFISPQNHLKKCASKSRLEEDVGVCLLPFLEQNEMKFIKQSFLLALVF